MTARTTEDFVRALAESITESVAILADEESLGVDGNRTEVMDWHRRLQEAIDDGLEAAYDRAAGLPR